MAELICERVSRGMRDSERTVTIRDAVNGRRDFLRVEADFLTFNSGRYYLPVGIVQEEPQQGLVLIELPQESETGYNRHWVRTEDLLQTNGASS